MMRGRTDVSSWSCRPKAPCSIGETALARSRTATADQISVLRLVDQSALLDPRHHVAELFADLLDRMRGKLGAGRLERGLVDLVLQHPVAGKLAGLNVGQNPAHLLLG